MKTFASKEKEISRKMASNIWNAFAQRTKWEFDRAQSFNSGQFIEEFGWEYDKEKYIGEHQYVYVFLIYEGVSRLFPSNKRDAILREFNKILIDNGLEYLLDGVKEYEKVWNECEMRSEISDEDLALNNPIYCIAKLASIRCFGEDEGVDPQKINILRSVIIPFVDMLSENFQTLQSALRRDG